MKNLLKAHSAILGANIIYGLNFIIVKEVVPEYMHPYGLSVLRSSGALLLLWMASIFMHRQKVDRADIWKLIVAGLLGVSINQTLLITGLNYTTSVNASIIMTSNPVFVMLVSALFLKIPITPIKILGIIIGASGAILIITSNGNFSFDSDNFLGDIIIAINAVMYASYLVWVKPLMAKYHPMTVMRWMFLFGGIAVLLFGWDELIVTDFSAIPTIAFWAIGFIVVCATFLTYLLNVIGLQYVNPTTVSIYVYIQPLIVAVIVSMLGKNTFDTTKLLAMVLVFVGVYLVNKTNTVKEKG